MNSDRQDTGRLGDFLSPGRDRVDAFVARHFTWPGTVRLHRRALGWDILRAPANLLLAPVMAMTLVTAWGMRRLRFGRAADWLSRRRLLLRTAVSRRVEELVAHDLLNLPRAAAGGDLARAILAAPQFRGALRQTGDVGAAHAKAQRIATAVRDYAGTRSAVAEMTASVITLAVGALLFQAVTPGMVSMAPGVAEAVSRSTAIADFPLGQTLGGAWYGVFPIGATPGMVAATLVVLMMVGAVVATFAGILADPVQAWSGIHRRRLLRLLATVDSELHGAGERPFAAREHLYARVLDLWDTALSLVRALRS